MKTYFRLEDTDYATWENTRRASFFFFCSSGDGAFANKFIVANMPIYGRQQTLAECKLASRNSRLIDMPVLRDSETVEDVVGRLLREIAIEGHT